MVLIARSGRLAHDHVARGILRIFDIVPAGEVDQKLDDLPLLLRGARNLCDGIELFPDDAGFESGDC